MRIIKATLTDSETSSQLTVKVQCPEHGMIRYKLSNVVIFALTNSDTEISPPCGLNRHGSAQ